MLHEFDRGLVSQTQSSMISKCSSYLLFLLEKFSQIGERGYEQLLRISNNYSRKKLRVIFVDHVHTIRFSYSISNHLACAAVRTLKSCLRLVESIESLKYCNIEQIKVEPIRLLH